MEGDLDQRPIDIERELLRFPSALCEEFQRAKRPMRRGLDEGQFLAWAQEGLSLARQGVRSWETAREYFKASAEVLRCLPFVNLIRWSQSGRTLCKASPALAAAFFKASPAAVTRLRPGYIGSWALLGQSLYKGTWKSSTLAAKFFDVGPALLQVLTFREMERFVAFLDLLSHRSYDMASDCLILGERVFSHLGPDKEAFFSLATGLVESNWRDAKSLFEAGAKSLPKVEAGQRLRFLKLAERFGKGGEHSIPSFIQESANAMAQMEPATHPHILSLSEALLSLYPSAAIEFIKSCPTVLDRISVDQLEVWFNEGLRILQGNGDGGLTYFRVESSRSKELVESLSSGVELERIREIMRMYCRALAGSTIGIATTQELVDKNIGWVSEQKASTEGTTVYLPERVDRYDSKGDNFSWFKVVSTHQAAHLEFGSFKFLFEEPSPLFKDLRLGLARGKGPASGDELPQEQADTAERGWLTDMQRFFDLFEDRKLALDVFTIVEDGRLDARVKKEYPGIRRAYERIQRDSLKGRPLIESLPAREAIVEFLVRLSLRQDGSISVPEAFVKEAKAIARIAKRVLSPLATVQDASEATIRIYAIISRIPNEKQPPESWEDLDIGEEDGEYMDPEGLEELLQQMGQPGMQRLEETEEEYDSPQDVDYRGEFKPELVQLLSKLKMQQQEGRGEASQALSMEMLEELLRSSAELDLQVVSGDVDDRAGVFANNIVKEAGMAVPQTPQLGQGPLIQVDEDGGSLEATEPLTFLYDEWDFRAEDYKPSWCMIREKIMAEGDSLFYTETLKSYAAMVGQIRRQFEMVVPEMFRRVKRLTDGEEYDLDAIIDAFVDIRTGNSPSDKLYWRRNKVQRDVAVVFLLDMSASTAEAIDDSSRRSNDWGAPDNPAEYMAWLRTRRSEGVRRTYKRIVDLEKESTVLLINALEDIGDTYGIYGFSGYGRENVEFYVIKDIQEAFSDRVKRRIDRIAPLHATRMGPAIRHAVSKLETLAAKTKILFLISDGRPQDRGYSREGVEKEYAVHDTKMALTEAKRKEIVPFCLTVDKAGHDYLKTMCQDVGYEVMDDIYALPQRLPFLYRNLTL